MNEKGQNVHIYYNEKFLVSREEFVELCKNGKPIWLAFRSFTNIPENKNLNPFDDIDGYLIEIDGSIYIRKDNQKIPKDDIGFPLYF